MNKKLDFNMLKTAEAYKVSFADTSYINGDYARNMRDKLGLTQVVFSTIIGIKEKTLEKWERRTKAIPKTSALLIYLINNNDDVLHLLFSINKE